MSVTYGSQLRLSLSVLHKFLLDSKVSMLKKKQCVHPGVCDLLAAVVFRKCENG